MSWDNAILTLDSLLKYCQTNSAPICLSLLAHYKSAKESFIRNPLWLSRAGFSFPSVAADLIFKLRAV
jgi:hypothetical protein